MQLEEPAADHAAWLRSYVEDSCGQVLRLLSDGQANPPSRVLLATAYKDAYILQLCRYPWPSWPNPYDEFMGYHTTWFRYLSAKSFKSFWGTCVVP